MAAIVQDKSGKTPLQYLLTQDQPIDSSLIKKFVSVAPKALEMMDNRDRTPLDIAKLKKEQSASLMNLLARD